MPDDELFALAATLTTPNGHRPLVTASNSEVPTSEFRRTPAEREPAPRSRKSEPVDWRSMVTRCWFWARSLWSDPEPLTKRQPTAAELLTYAREGAWTKRPDGPIRGLGVLWCFLVAIPVTWLCNLISFFAQRPGRTAVVVGLSLLALL
jgi:hypothetical protein